MKVATSSDEALARAIAERREQDQRLRKDRLLAIEFLAREAKESVIEGCGEAQDGLSYVVAFDLIELLAGAILKAGPKE